MKLGNKIKGGTKLSLRFLWYLGASILILSLPTFSYLVPRVDPPSPAPIVQESSPDPAAEKRSVSGRATPGRGFVRPPRVGRGVARTSSGKRVTQPPARRPRPSRERAERPPAKTEPQETPSAERSSGDPVQEASQRPRPVPGTAPGLAPPVQAAMAQQLQQLQQEYDQVQQNLFPQLALGLGPARGNPFQEAIETEPPPPDTVTDPPPAEDPPPPADAVDEVPDDIPPPEPIDDLPDVGGGGDGAEPEPYNFLITGHFSEAPTRVWRARRDSISEFSLENSGTVNLFPGFLGSVVTFGPQDKVIISDLNKDGLDDFVVARLAPGVGTAVESYLAGKRGSFELHASTILYLRAVRSFTLFDFNNDGQDELALLLAGQPHLFIYEKDEQDWVYRREIVLPWPAGMLIRSVSGAAPRSVNLYVLDGALQRVVAINSRFPSAFVYDVRAPLSFKHSIEVRLVEGVEGSETVGLLMPDQVVLIHRTAAGEINPFVTFADADKRMPVTIIGDYSERGHREVLWIP